MVRTPPRFPRPAVRQRILGIPPAARDDGRLLRTGADGIFPSPPLLQREELANRALAGACGKHLHERLYAALPHISQAGVRPSAPCSLGSSSRVSFGGTQRVQRSGDQLGASRCMLDLVGMRLLVRTRRDDEPLFASSPATSSLIFAGDARATAGSRQAECRSQDRREPVPSWPKPSVREAHTAQSGRVTRPPGPRARRPRRGA